MERFLRKHWLPSLTLISLIFNVIAGLLLYQNSETPGHSAQEDLVKPPPFDYESFKDAWGKAWLGLEVSDVPLAIAVRAGLDRAEGAYVRTVAVGSPAQKADIAPGDVILSFNGRKIRNAKQFQNDMLGSEVGTEVYMCVAKDDYRITVYAVPEARLNPVTKAFPWLGIEVAEVASGSDEANKIEEAGKAGGVLVERILGDSPAEKADLEEGDIIMSFNSRKTRTLQEFLTDLAGADAGDQVRMCIMRDDIRKTIYVTLARAPRYTSI